MFLMIFRLFFILFVVLTVLRWVLLVYARSLRREELEQEWDLGDQTGERETFVREGLERWQKGFRHRLFWFVYILPLATVFGLIWYFNYR